MKSKWFITIEKKERIIYTVKLVKKQLVHLIIIIIVVYLIIHCIGYEYMVLTCF